MWFPAASPPSAACLAKACSAPPSPAWSAQPHSATPLPAPTPPPEPQAPPPTRPPSSAEPASSHCLHPNLSKCTHYRPTRPTRQTPHQPHPTPPLINANPNLNPTEALPTDHPRNLVSTEALLTIVISTGGAQRRSGETPAFRFCSCPCTPTRQPPTPPNPAPTTTNPLHTKSLRLSTIRSSPAGGRTGTHRPGPRIPLIPDTLPVKSLESRLCHSKHSVSR
jgi:hypothetical protein